MDARVLASIGAPFVVAALGAAGSLWMADVLPRWRLRAADRAGHAHGPAHWSAPRRPGARLGMTAVVLCATLLLFALLDGPSGRAAMLWLYTLALVTIAVIDLEHRLVLNVMLGPLAVIALLLGSAMGPGLQTTLGGGLCGLGVFLAIGLMGRGKLGAGDVKLAGVIGLMVGWPAVMAALAVGVVLGGLAALLLLVSGRATRTSSMAYAPYLVAGALWTLWLPLVAQ